MNRRHLDHLTSLCAGWGGRLLVVNDARWESWFGPGHQARGYDAFPGDNGLACYGVHWKEKRVIVAGEPKVHPIIHEMGHVFASLKEPEDADEYGFLGWEIALARQVGCYRQWSAGMSPVGYVVEPLTRLSYWSDQEPSERRRIIGDSLRSARAAGLLDVDLRPMAIR